MISVMLNQKGISSLIIIGIISVALVFILYSLRSFSDSSENITSTTVPISSPSPDLEAILEDYNYDYNRFRPDDEILKTYPKMQQFLVAHSYDGVGIDCKDFYRANTYHYQPENIHISISESAIYQTKADLLKDRLSEYTNSLILCKTEDDRWFGVYDIVNQMVSGGGNPFDSFVVEIKDDEVIDLAKIPAKKIAYYGCGFPFMLTKSGDLYLLCNGGDGGCTPRAADFYKVNTKTKTLAAEVVCENTPDDSCEYKAVCK